MALVIRVRVSFRISVRISVRFRVVEFGLGLHFELGFMFRVRLWVGLV